MCIRNSHTTHTHTTHLGTLTQPSCCGHGFQGCSRQSKLLLEMRSLQTALVLWTPFLACFLYLKLHKMRCMCFESEVLLINWFPSRYLRILTINFVNLAEHKLLTQTKHKTEIPDNPLFHCHSLLSTAGGLKFTFYNQKLWVSRSEGNTIMN